jgi:hypothetical protein
MLMRSETALAQGPGPMSNIIRICNESGNMIYLHSQGPNAIESFLFHGSDSGDSADVCISIFRRAVSLDATFQMHIPLASYSWSNREPIRDLLFRQSVEDSYRIS